MKKIFLFSTLAFLFVFSSCQKEEIQKIEPSITDRYGNLIKAISESENYYDLITYQFKTLKVGILSLDRKSMLELQRFEEIANKGNNLSENELSNLLKLYGFSSKEQLIDFMKILTQKQKVIHEEFPELNQLSFEEVGIVMGEAFKSCDKCINDILRFDAKTSTSSDDPPEGGVFELYSCSPLPALQIYTVDLDGDGGEPYCCNNWFTDNIKTNFENCAVSAVSRAQLFAIGCAGTAVTTTTAISAKTIAAGTAVGGPVGAVIAGGVTILGGGIGLYLCLDSARNFLTGECGKCIAEAKNDCVYFPCD